MNKIRKGLVIGSVALVSAFSSAVLFNGIAHGEWDFPGLQQQVQHVTEVTNNHEGRITNLESQANTPSGQPVPTPVVITKVVTEAAPAAVVPVVAPVVTPPAPTPTPVYIVEWSRVGKSDCNRVYTLLYYLVHWSDGHSTHEATQPTSGKVADDNNSFSVCSQINQ